MIYGGVKLKWEGVRRLKRKNCYVWVWGKFEGKRIQEKKKVHQKYNFFVKTMFGL